MKPISVSVVVPAWNEASALPLLLESLLTQRDIAIEAVVVANGCVDETAALARNFIEAFSEAGHRLRVLELGAASKSAALQAGDSASEVFPRAYIDADVVLSSNALRQVAAALEVPEPRAASPRLRFSAPPDTAELAVFVEGIPPFSTDVVGGGFYAVNKSGRERWFSFPEVIADDTYVLSHFSASERHVVTTAEFHCRFPPAQRLAEVLARWELGRLQLGEAGVRVRGSAKFKAALVLAGNPRRWRNGLQWFRLKRAARATARSRLADGDLSWSRADNA